MNKQFSIILISIFLIIISCDNQQKISKEYHGWIMENTTKDIQSIKSFVDERGSRKSDVEILENVLFVHEQISGMIDNVENQNSVEIEKGVNEIINKFKLTKIGELAKFQTDQNENEIKIQLALLEEKIINELTVYIGTTDYSFDQLELVFVPNRISLDDNGNLNGKLIFAATTSRLGEIAKMYLDGDSIPINGGKGIINVSKPDLGKNGKSKVEIELNGKTYSSSINYDKN